MAHSETGEKESATEKKPYKKPQLRSLFVSRGTAACTQGKAFFATEPACTLGPS